MKGNDNMYSDSDEDQHDAYLERMKQEGKIREEANDSDDSEGESGEGRAPDPPGGLSIRFAQCAGVGGQCVR